MGLEELWQTTLNEMEVQLSRANFATWLKNSRLKDKKDGTFYITLPNNFAKEWVSSKYEKNILGIMRRLDSSAKKLEFSVEIKNQAVKTGVNQQYAEAGGGSFETEFKIDPETNLNPKYALKSFVVGP